MSADAIAAIRAWTLLDQAITGFNRVLAQEYGVTGAQLAVLRLVGEWAGEGTVSLGDMRERLVMHPATLGQLLDRLAARRLVGLTGAGRRLVDRAPVAGPVRLRYVDVDPVRLQRLAAALEDAVALFGLEEYLHDRSGKPGERRPEAGG